MPGEIKLPNEGEWWQIDMRAQSPAFTMQGMRTEVFVPGNEVTINDDPTAQKVDAQSLGNFWSAVGA